MYVFERNGVSLPLETTPALFSPHAPDRGTLGMLDVFETHWAGKGEALIAAGRAAQILDLGCGCGLVGLYLAKKYGKNVHITLSDIDASAVMCAQKNAEINRAGSLDSGGLEFFVSDGFTRIPAAGFDCILSNPPYHTDFSVAKHFIHKGFNRLALGGTLWMVTKRREWYKQKFISIFGGVTVTERDGYFIFAGEKQSLNYSRSS